MYVLRWLLIPIIFVISGIAKAQDHDSEHTSKHHLALFVGGGTEKEHHHSEAGSALGLKYEFHFHQRWSIGGDLEKLFGSETDRSYVVVLPVSFHLNESWRIFAGPGYEFHGKHDKALLRTGIAYEWEFENGWSLSPELIADFLDGGAKTYVAGISIGRHF